jgi:hypothetical protein
MHFIHEIVLLPSVITVFLPWTVTHVICCSVLLIVTGV